VAEGFEEAARAVGFTGVAAIEEGTTEVTAVTMDGDTTDEAITGDTAATVIRGGCQCIRRITTDMGIGSVATLESKGRWVR
jgi:hypothetical protein